MERRTGDISIFKDEKEQEELRTAKKEHLVKEGNQKSLGQWRPKEKSFSKMSNGVRGSKKAWSHLLTFYYTIDLYPISNVFIIILTLGWENPKAAFSF